jgi:hypothetical protein
MSGVALGSTTAVAVGSNVGAGPGWAAQETRSKNPNTQNPNFQNPNLPSLSAHIMQEKSGRRDLALGLLGFGVFDFIARL